MNNKKIITVFGAIGAQGGGLARAILNDKKSEFALSAVTRDPGSEKARELANMGAQVVAADIDDYNSIKEYTFPLGDKKMAGISSDNIGACAYGIFREGEKMIGKTVGVAGDQLTCDEMARKMSKALGEVVSYNEITPEQFHGFGFPGADDLGNMFQFYRDYDEVCNKTRDVSRSKKLHPGLKSFDEWLEQNASKIPLE